MTSLILIVTSGKPHQDQVKQYLLDQQLLSPAEPETNLTWYNQEEDSLKIKTVRELTQQSAYQTYNQETQFFILLKADTASIPAQNALLKIVEEPPANTQLILTVTDTDQLLPTIQSRCLIKKIASSPQQTDGLKTDPEIQQIIDQLSDLNSFSYSQIIELADQYKNRSEAQTLVKNLIQVLYNSHIPNRTEILERLSQTYDRLEKNANVKLTLENCFFSIKSAG